MMRVVLAGGGTAGHVNPLLAVADELVRQGEASPSDIFVIGTAEGLETRLVPDAGFALGTIARLPFPRRMSAQALLFWPRFIGAVLASIRMIRAHQPDVVAGFGGYVSAPVYVAAWLARVPLGDSRGECCSRVCEPVGRQAHLARGDNVFAHKASRRTAPGNADGSPNHSPKEPAHSVLCARTLWVIAPEKDSCRDGWFAGLCCH
jgi:hypothetical protein